MIDSAFAPTSSGVGTDYSSASVPISSQPGVVPPAPPSVPPAYSNPTPPAKKKGSSSFFKLFGLGVVLVVLVGGLITAYVLSQQQQEIRQQASQADNYTQNPFTFQDVQNVDLTFLPDAGQTGAPGYVKGKFSYVSNPSCDANMSCSAAVKFEISEVDTDLICTTNTANLVHYKFLTNTSDPNYPGNLTHNTPTVNANCNRPLSQCDNDPNCTRSDVIRLYGPSGCGDRCTVFEATLPFSVTNTEYGCGCVQFDPNISVLSLNCRPRDVTETRTYTFTRDTTNDQGPWAYAYNTAQCSTPVSPSPTATITPTPTTPAGPTNSPTPTQAGGPSATPTPTATQIKLTCEQCDLDQDNKVEHTAPTKDDLDFIVACLGQPANSESCKRANLNPQGTLINSGDVNQFVASCTGVYANNMTCSTPTATPTPPPFGGMCLSISMSPATPAYNDSVTFTCGLVQGVAKYEFRYFEPGVLTPTKLDASSGNVSKAIKVTKAGTYTAQCRICPPVTSSNTYCNDPNWGWDPTITTQSR